MESIPTDGLRGTTIAGRYRVDELIGSSGMAAVFRAWDLQLERAVAVKVILPKRRDDPAMIERFRREARLMASLAHPHIVVVHDFGTTESGLLFLSMELVAGDDLRAHIKQAPGGRIPWRDAVVYARQLTSGLLFAHERGVLHRDLKPENVFIARLEGERSSAKLLDFGIARKLDDAVLAAAPKLATLTAPDQLLGSPGYMPPEAWQGRVDGSADHYALGVVVFEMLTGARPFAAADVVQLILMQQSGEAARVGTFGVDVPPRLDELVAQLLKKNPAERPSLVDVARVLDEVASAPDRPDVGRARAALRGPRRHVPLPAAAAAAAAAALAITIAWGGSHHGAGVDAGAAGGVELVGGSGTHIASAADAGRGGGDERRVGGVVEVADAGATGEGTGGGASAAAALVADADAGVAAAAPRKHTDKAKAKVPVCPRGKERNVDTQGNCCWPGQVWTDQCVGAPTCPPPLVSPGAGTECECAGGRVLLPDSFQCCWPGQGFSTVAQACVGDVGTCSPGYVPTSDRRACEPKVVALRRQLASKHAELVPLVALAERPAWKPSLSRYTWTLAAESSCTLKLVVHTFHSSTGPRSFPCDVTLRAAGFGTDQAYRDEIGEATILTFPAKSKGDQVCEQPVFIGDVARARGERARTLLNEMATICSELDG